MNQTSLSSFIWSVADLLRGNFKQSDYGKVILPFTVLRRMDCVLAPTKQKVLAEVGKKQAAGKEDTALDLANIPALLVKLKAQMKEAAADLNFERAASLRDRIRELEQLDLILR